MKSIQLTNGAFFVSSSFLEGLETCPRKTEYSVLERRLRVEEGNALHFGSILHSALNMHYRQQEFGTSKDEVMAKVVKVVQAAYKDRPESDDFRNLNWAITLYQKYVEKFEWEEFKLLEYKEAIACPQCRSIIDHHYKCEWCNGSRNQKIMVEVPFAAKLFDFQQRSTLIPVYYRGFIDLPVSFNNKVYVLDFKTTSMLGETFWDDKKMSNQQRSYAWGLAKTTNLDVVGYIIRAIRVLSPPQYVSNGTANKKGEFKKITDWWNECMVEQKFPFNEETLLEWEENAKALVEEFFWHYSREYFPKKTMWCVGKYGKCGYFDVCSLYPQKDRAQILYSGLYKDKEDAFFKT